MKVISPLFIVLLLLSSCAQAPDADQAQVEDVSASELVNPTKQANTDAKNYAIESPSQISWIGTKPTGQHSGTLAIRKGELLVDKNNSVSGRFQIDMKSLQITDLEGEQAEKLSSHLISKDFFKVKKHPSATFILTGTKPFSKRDYEGQEVKLTGATHTATGHLNLLGVTKKISFPAIINIEANGIQAKANFNIDRTQWGVSYGSDQSLGDRFIRPEVNIGLDISAK